MTLRTFQIGMHWFGERAGGLDRVYFELGRALPGVGVGFAGVVAGSGMAAAQTGGAVTAFAAADEALWRRWWGVRRAVAAALKEQRPDLVVSHFALYTLPVLDLLRGRKLVVHFQGPWADEGAVEGNAGVRRSVKRWVENLVYRRAARVIVLSRAFADLLVERYGYPRARIDVIPGGVDVGRFAVAATRDEARARLGWPAEKKIVVAVRRLVPRMGLENLIDAVAEIRREIPEVLVMIAGRGVLAQALAARIAAAGLEGQVKLLGFVSDDDLPLVYRAADLSVVPTVALEGFGLIAAESLAAGTPCLVAPVGGLPEVVGGLSKNMILRSAGAADIAQGVCDGLAGRLSLPAAQACRDYAAATFGWEVIAGQVAAVYAQVLDGRD